VISDFSRPSGFSPRATQGLCGSPRRSIYQAAVSFSLLRSIKVKTDLPPALRILSCAGEASATFSASKVMDEGNLSG
jgi:hypothetical protein